MVHDRSISKERKGISQFMSKVKINIQAYLTHKKAKNTLWIILSLAWIFYFLSILLKTGYMATTALTL